MMEVVPESLYKEVRASSCTARLRHSSSRDKAHLFEIFSMGNQNIVSIAAMVALILGAFVAIPTGAQLIGVCYGMGGNNLPQPRDVVNLYESKNLKAMRLFEPNQHVLQALKGSNIQLTLGVPNADLQSLASNRSAANGWVRKYVKAYSSGVSFKYIAVGNRAIPGNQAQYVLPAMRSIHSALSSAGLQNQIKVSTSIATGREVLEQYSPPSSGRFSSGAARHLRAIVRFLANNRAPLLINVYPYRSYVGDPNHVGPDHPFFNSSRIVIQDGPYGYQNLFDAIVDAVYVASEKVGGPNLMVVVSESGWPSAGGFGATKEHARRYNQNLINHVGQGTPRRLWKSLETYVFEMFNENQKPRGAEQHFGMFHPNMQPVYPINFN
ncbi:Glucan endo-1,3-beta-glucosidase [Cocos nucifera]|uniref:Glucan endo-1,3-beta-glucosidase n=1 Tax=Cocos nucifera TaxID=13894 RepID=A0A8K0N4D7_COCNU|nr:Glucan endo-1,3-beta-glucosidase [Cocos nucifera]